MSRISYSYIPNTHRTHTQIETDPAMLPGFQECASITAISLPFGMSGIAYFPNTLRTHTDRDRSGPYIGVPGVHCLEFRGNVRTGDSSQFQLPFKLTSIASPSSPHLSDDFSAVRRRK